MADEKHPSLDKVNELFGKLSTTKLTDIPEEDENSSMKTHTSEEDGHEPEYDIHQASSSTTMKRKSTDTAQPSRENVTAGDDAAPTNIHPLKPGSRILPSDTFYITKTITENMEMTVLDNWQAGFIADEPGLIHLFSLPTYEERFLAFDEYDEGFNLLISVHMEGIEHNYKLTEGWERFVRKHNLRVGDEVRIYKVWDKEITENYYFVLKFSRKAKAAKLTNKEDQEQQPPRDGDSKGKDKSVRKGGPFMSATSDKGVSSSTPPANTSASDRYVTRSIITDSPTTRKCKSTGGDQISRENVGDLLNVFYIQNETNSPAKSGSRILSTDILSMMTLTEVDVLLVDDEVSNDQLLCVEVIQDVESPLA